MPLLVSHISQASSFCVNGYDSSLSHNEQQEGVVNVSLHVFCQNKIMIDFQNPFKFLWCLFATRFFIP